MLIRLKPPTKNLQNGYPEVTIKAISGDMKAKEVQEGIEAFAQNQANILISTTIVEVGVNVPNATVIVIKNAERFGLAQLHQLRGRVGRSSLQSYCVRFWALSRAAKTR